jgi:uncharacterized membrane protein YfcA
LAGVLIGFVAVTLGGGGGGVYIGLLTEGFHVPPAIAVSTSLATIVPTVLIGAFSHWRNGNVRLDVGWPALVGGSMGAATGGLLSSLIPAHLYMRGLGAMTLAMLLLIFLEAKAGQVPRLAGQDEENYPAHSGMGNERSAGRHFLPFGLPLGQEARGLHLPRWETA